MRVLVVDDDAAIVEVVAESLRSESCEVTSASSGENGWVRFQEQPYNLLISDVRMPGMDGVELMQRARSLNPDLATILMSAYPLVGDAAHALQNAAAEYMPKPFTLRQIQAVVAKRVALPGRRPESSITGVDRFESLIGTSPAMQRMFSLLEKVAVSDSTVLLAGESGVGKGFIVEKLHALHPTRRTGPLVSVHCGAIPDTLIESELFGHVRGSFTGADRDRVGHFELAQGGTLLLDEIGTMGLGLQVKLLQVLQERRVTRVGGSRSIDLDVRIVAATNDNLRQRVAEGTFREDLFYRLNVIPVEVPPLRERKDDIPQLTKYFVKLYEDRMGLDATGVSPEAMKVLSDYHWPGNIRELRNAVEYAMVVGGCNGSIQREDLPALRKRENSSTTPDVQLGPQGLSLRSLVSNLERDLILQSLQLADGNRARAAELLELKRTTFIEKLRKLAPEAC